MPVKLSKKRKGKLKEMIKKDFSNAEIAGALKISRQTVMNYRSKKNVKPGITTQIKEGAGDIGAGDPGPAGSQDQGGQPGNKIDNNDAVGEINKKNEDLIFIGGKKYMTETENKKADEKDEYQCYNCAFVQGSMFSKCPKCGASNSFDE